MFTDLDSWDDGSPSITCSYLSVSFRFGSFMLLGIGFGRTPNAPVLDWEYWENSQSNSQLYFILNSQVKLNSHSPKPFDA